MVRRKSPLISSSIFFQTSSPDSCNRCSSLRTGTILKSELWQARGNHLLVLFRLKRARGINQPSAGRNMAHGRFENCDLARLQIEKVFRLELPFDFRIARQRSCAGAGDIGQHAVEVCAVRQSQRVRGDDFYILLRREPAQKSCAMRMQFRGNDLCFRQTRGHGGGLTAGSGAAIEYAPAFADERGHQLRAFILNGDLFLRGTFAWR